MPTSFQDSVAHISVLLLSIAAPVLQAATVIEVQSSSELTTIMTDGRSARMNMPGDEYVIVDYRQHTVKLVNPKKQQVMVLNADNMATGNNAPRVHTAIKNLGAGITVAGYPTQKYAYSANGKYCGVIYGSMGAYQQQGIKQLFQAMDTMIEQQSAVLGGLAGMIDDCTLAEMEVGDHVRSVGVPMRTEKNGRVESEIKSIKHDVALPADTFVVPASYKTMTLLEQIGAVASSISNMQRQKTQRQPPPMPQYGRVTPEMMEQVRRSQEMMRQYQQPAYR